MKQIAHKIALLTAILCGVLCTHCDRNEDPDDPFAEGVFAVRFDELTTSTVKAYITPQDPKQIYFFSIVRKSDFAERWGGDVSKYLPDHIESLRRTHGCSLEEAIAMLKHSGESVAESSSLFPSVTYVVLVAGVDDTGNPTTQPVVKEFTTAELPKVDCNFNIDISDIGSSLANVDIRPSDMDAYMCGAWLVQLSFPPCLPNIMSLHRPMSTNSSRMLPPSIR